MLKKSDQRKKLPPQEKYDPVSVIRVSDKLSEVSTSTKASETLSDTLIIPAAKAIKTSAAGFSHHSIIRIYLYAVGRDMPHTRASSVRLMFPAT